MERIFTFFINLIYEPFHIFKMFSLSIGADEKDRKKKQNFYCHFA